MNTWDAIGYVTSTLVLTACGMKSIIPLRVVAMRRQFQLIMSAYGSSTDICLRNCSFSFFERTWPNSQ